MQHNFVFLKFMWKAEVVESWIKDIRTTELSSQYKREVAHAPTLLTKQKVFDLVLKPFKTEGLQNLDTLKKQIINVLNIYILMS